MCLNIQYLFITSKENLKTTIMKNLVLFFLTVTLLNCSNENDASENLNVESSLISKDNLYGNGQEGITQQNLHTDLI